MLLVHGLNGFKEGWGPLPDGLAAAGLRAVAVDLPGFGSTPRLGARTTPAALARSLDDVIGELEPVAVVGHSLGAQVAIVAAAVHPSRVRSLVLISPWVLPRPRRMPPKGMTDVLQLPLVGPLLARLAIARIRRDPQRRREAFLSAIADRAALTRDPEMSALLADASDRLAHADLRAMADWAASGLAYDVRPTAGALAAPALVVAGTLDRVTPLAGAQRLAQTLPGGTLLTVPGVAHFPHLERRDLVVPAIVEHLP